MNDEQKLQHYEALRAYADALEAERDALAARLARVETFMDYLTGVVDHLPKDHPSAACYKYIVRHLQEDIADPAPDARPLPDVTTRPGPMLANDEGDDA